MKDKNRVIRRLQKRWGSFRLSVVGSLLASPPSKGELNDRLNQLSETMWNHPITGEPTRFAFSTIEQWYYLAKKEPQNPVNVLERKIRKDSGEFRAIPIHIRDEIRKLYKDHPGWSHQLHFDNLICILSEKSLSESLTYTTVRRYRNANGMLKVKMIRNSERPGEIEAAKQFEPREQRTYEATHVLGLIHSDYHHCSRKLLKENGEWAKPVLVAFLDDLSRLVLHAQWYWYETAENFIHALCQAFLKRGLPRALMTDNGSPMTAAETTEGLKRLSIIHSTTLPYTPQQNGKQENFWGQIEGRLMPMLEGEENLTLKMLNDATIAWLEMDYHRKIHSEINTTPLQKFLEGPDVSRKSPSPEELQRAFTFETKRKLRRSDCTISLEGQRYEIPSTHRHLKDIFIRYASWDLANVFLVNQKSGDIVHSIYPRDLHKNANGKRKVIESSESVLKTPDRSSGVAPLLKRYLSDYSATGLPMAYIPKEEKDRNNAKA